MSITDKDVIIAGGGIAGLSLGIALLQFAKAKGIAPPPRVTVYERDAAPDSRAYQGYSMSIRDAGFSALERLGLADLLVRSAAPSHKFSVVNEKLESILDAPVHSANGKRTSVRLPRFGLRRALLDAAEAAGVRVVWDSVATNATQQEGAGRVRLELSSGASAEADLVVAADGSRSRLRQALLPDQTLRFAGFTAITGRSEFMAPRIAEGHMLVVAPDGTSAFLAAVSDSQTAWSISRLADGPRTDYPGDGVPRSTEQIEELKAEALAMVAAAGYSNILAEAIRRSENPSVRVLNGFDKPPHRSVGRVAFVGDATHPVTPFAGYGACMALDDGVRLAEALTDARHGTIDAALREFDDGMVARSAEVIQRSRQTIAMAHLRSPLKRVLRYALFRTVHAAINHGRRVRVGVLVSLGVACAAVFNRYRSQSAAVQK